MAGYFDQCACGEYTCVGGTPCRQCLEAENKRLREALEYYAESTIYGPGYICADMEVARQALKGGGSDEE